jgi:cytochrome c peroxidase
VPRGGLFWDGRAGTLQTQAMAPLFDPVEMANRGLCGPSRTDLTGQTQYCGMFRTPSLRNVATRRVFFHNGRYHTLEDVLAFYALRDARPGAVYPRGPDARVRRFDDLPARYRPNVDVADPPFGRQAGEPSPLGERDRRDIIAFLKTLTDGWRAAP